MRTRDDENALRQFRRLKKFLTIKDGKLQYKGKTVLKGKQINKLVKATFNEKKSLGCRSLFKCLQNDFTGISRKKIYQIQQSRPLHQKFFPKFTNKPIMIPIISKRVNQRWQMDLVDMKDEQMLYHGVNYRLVHFLQSKMTSLSHFQSLLIALDKKCIQHIHTT